MRYIRRFAAVIIAVVTAAALAVGAAAQDIQFGEVYAEYGAANLRAVAAPRANYDSGDYEETINVRLTCSTSGARIFYTTDGSIPNYYSDIYSESIRIKPSEGTVVIRAFAVRTGYEDSAMVEFTYNMSEPVELAVTYMEIYRNPTKTNYSKGDTLSLTGGKISVTYEDRTYENIPMTQSMVSGFNSNTAGEKEITVYYEGFTDTFTVYVREGYESGSGTDTGATSPKPSTTPSDEEEDTDELPQISGSTLTGWSSIEKELATKPSQNSVTIMLNGAVSVPDSVIRAAAKNDLRLTFVTDEGYKWYLNTSAINKDTIIPKVGLGIRVSPIYIPGMLTNNTEGTEAARFHVNSENKLGAELLLNVGAENKEGFAALYRYDSVTNSLIFTDNARISSSGATRLAPELGGDYVVFISTTTVIRGDLDDNLIVNALDAALFMKTLVNGDIPENDKWDVNSDGMINALDAAAILKKSVA